MLLPMLKAVSKMLDYPTPNTAAEAELEKPFRIQVGCAKIILDEIITNLESNPIPENPKPVYKEKTQAAKPDLQPKATLEPKPEVEIPTDKEWFVTVSDKGDLFIQGYPEDGMVELDGVKMKYKDTVGKKFKKARIL